MVVLVRHKDRKDQSKEELPEFSPWVVGVGPYEINDLSVRSTRCPGLAQGSTGRDIRNASGPAPIEPPDERDRKGSIGKFQPRGWCADPAGLCQTKRGYLDPFNRLLIMN